mmetsp:Transcript_41790/g.110415  ORF Transcript_41790/g.110415 Transcript_41790/m.110415 type:complete len:296 (-) Transcript_41790:566-1453(-)
MHCAQQSYDAAKDQVNLSFLVNVLQHVPIDIPHLLLLHLRLLRQNRPAVECHGQVYVPDLEPAITLVDTADCCAPKRRLTRVQVLQVLGLAIPQSMAIRLEFPVVHEILPLCLVRLFLDDLACAGRRIVIYRIKVHDNAKHLQSNIHQILLGGVPQVATVRESPTIPMFIREQCGHQAAEEVRRVTDLTTSEAREPDWGVLLVLLGILEKRPTKASQDAPQDLSPSSAVRCRRHVCSAGSDSHAAFPNDPIIHSMCRKGPTLLPGHLIPWRHRIAGQEQETPNVVQDVVPAHGLS